MDMLPVYMRITGLTVANEDVDSRRDAIAKLALAWGRMKKPLDIVAKADGIAIALGRDGTPSSSLSVEVEGAVQEYASAFLSSERPLEVGICAGMAVAAVMSSKPGTNGLSTADLYSNALWSALEFQPALEEEKREQLRTHVLNCAKERSLKSADLARERRVVPELSNVTTTIGEDGTTTKFKKAMQGIIDALRRNAALDREELDFLWWAQLGRSRVLGRQLLDIPEPTRLVTMAIEGARLLRRLPTDVHRDLVLRTVAADPEMNLRELVEVIGPDRQVLISQISPDAISGAPSVYPLLSALISDQATGPAATKKRKVSTWASRALLEAALSRLTIDGTGVL